MADDANASDAADVNDPDAIAARPPPKAQDAKTFFQVGQHADKWSEYDERGVPTKNIKKKKPTKKEKEVLESEYLEASKAYQKYLKDVENWEQAKLDSEKDLKKSDRLRWAFRQVGQKLEPINADEMETIVKLMGWKALVPREFKVVKKGVTEIANSSGQIELEALRVYVREAMPIQLLQDRLGSEQLDSIELEDLYSPRTWRRKLIANPPQMKAKASPRLSARGIAKKGTAGGGSTSARGASGGGGTSARGKKGAQSPRSSKRGK